MTRKDRPAADRSPTIVHTTACLAAVAVLTSLLEFLALAYLKYGEHRFLFVPRQALWMVPLFHFIMAALALPLLRLARRIRPKLGSWQAIGFVGGTYVTANALLAFHPRLHYLAILIAALGVGSALGRLLARQTVRASRYAMRVALAGAAVLLLIAARPATWLEQKSAHPAPAGRRLPNIVFVILDTMRGDHMSSLGYRRATTPSLDKLARRGVLFDHAIAPAPWTLPSHASVFTGRWPFELTADWTTPLDATHPTLAEVLVRAGYRTAGFSANTRFVSYETGLARGFDHFDDYASSVARVFLATSVGRFIASQHRLRAVVGNEWNLDRRRAGDIRQAVEDWMVENADGAQPFFVFMNFLDTHHPYEPPAPFEGRFGGDGMDLTLTERLETVLNPVPDFRTDPVGIDSMIRLYDESLAYVDAELGRFFRGLDASGVLDNTIVIVTSDHGEHFGGHGLVEHGNSLYYPLIRVPLLIAFGDSLPHGLRLSEPVSLRDIPATIFDLAGIADDSIGLPGASLRAAWNAEQNPAELSPALAVVTGLSDKGIEVPISRGDMAALLVDSLLVIRSGDCSYELYDVDDDPLNRHDLFRTDTLLSRLLARMVDSLAPIAPPEPNRPPCSLHRF